MSFITKLFRKPEEENKTLKILLKIFLIVGIIVGLCVIAKIVYDKCKKSLNCFEEDDDCCFDDLLDDCDECDCVCECTDTVPCTCEEPAEA